MVKKSKLCRSSIESNTLGPKAGRIKKIKPKILKKEKCSRCEDNEISFKTLKEKLAKLEKTVEALKESTENIYSVVPVTKTLEDIENLSLEDLQKCVIKATSVL